MKLLLPLIFIIGFIHPSASQTLFTYGNMSVSKEEFLKAFEKNNTPSAGAGREKEIRNYLELYTRFKLKVQEAYDMKLDTLVSKQGDVLNFRKQIEEPFLTDVVEIERLTEEAFTRSQKDIRLAHIFIPFRMEYITNPSAEIPFSTADSLTALKKINEAHDRILKGEDFGTIAAAWSSDPSAAANKGEMGFITVFSLPYALENIVYALTPGKVSPPYKSSAGYHIFKHMEERSAAGKMKVEQILIAYDKTGGTAAKTDAAKIADSLYSALVKGASFERLAANYSFDILTRGAGGLMPLVGVGVYEKTFEDAVFALKKNGEISKPFETSNGIHIVKRLEHIPVEKNFSEAATSIKLAVDQDKRSGLARNSFEKKAKAQTGMKKTGFKPSELWRYTDSSLKKKPLPSSPINENTVLLEFPKAKITTADWIRFASISPSQTLADKYPQIWDEFETAKAIEYYRNHLDEFSPEFNQQLKEFMEGNLLFEIMERKVWSVSATDTAGLRKYYNQHKSTYVWNKSADAIMVNAADSITAVKIRKQLALKPASWKKLAAASDGTVIADSGRVEWSQIPAKPALIKAGLVTPVVLNEDRTSSFTYIIKTYPTPTPRSFNDARGLVMNDYQQEIENKWIGELKKKYPVKVNVDVLQSIIK